MAYNKGTVSVIVPVYKAELFLDRCVESLVGQTYDNLEIAALNKQYDVVLVIRGEAISVTIMEELHQRNPSAKFIMYQWDSIKNNRNCLRIEKYFDNIYTFDMDDAKEKGWKYRPLFYIETGGCVEKKNDFALVGTLYYRRAELLNKLKSYCSAHSFTQWNYLYSPKLVYLVHKYVLKDKRYAPVLDEDVKFVSLPLDELNRVYDETSILVDYTADDQSGLTMRTIESLGHRCKLITNNKKIMETDIYQWGNIFVYDFENFSIPEEFVKQQYNEMNCELTAYYSIKGWIAEVFG